MVRERLQVDRDLRLEYASPSRDVFVRTSAYLAALRKLGCGRPRWDFTCLTPAEQEQREIQQQFEMQVGRGYQMEKITCQGRLVFEYDSQGHPQVK